MSKSHNSNKNFLLTVYWSNGDPWQYASKQMYKRLCTFMESDGCTLNYFKFQPEAGTGTQREHLQMALQFTEHTIYATIKEIVGAECHIEVARSIDAVVNYCGKTRTRLGDLVYTNGVLRMKSQQGKRSDLDRLRQSIVDGKDDGDIIMEDSSNIRLINHIQRSRFAINQAKYSKQCRVIEVIYLTGPTGSGKTHYVYEKYGYENVFRVPPPASKDASLWFDGYNHQSVLFLDEFTGWCSYRFLLQLLDKYPLRMPIKNSHVMAAYTTVCIASCKPLEDQYPKIDDKSELYRRVHDTVVFNSPYVPVSEPVVPSNVDALADMMLNNSQCDSDMADLVDEYKHQESPIHMSNSLCNPSFVDDCFNLMRCDALVNNDVIDLTCDE